MKKVVRFLGIAILLGLLVSGCERSQDGAGVASGTKPTPSVYERVTQSGTLKAAFITYPPACMKNSATGEMTGIFVEVLQQMCTNLNLKLEWGEEVGWAAQIEGLESDRYDIVGSPVWANPVRGTKTTLSTPVYYSGIGVYVRANETRFSNDLNAINDPGVKIGTVDGETSDVIAKANFPKAARYSSPQTTDLPQKFLDLKTNKCDVFFTEPYFAYEFEQNNPGVVKNIAVANPIRLFGNCFMFKKNEFQMKHMLDIALWDLINSGFVNDVIKKYEPAPNLFYRVAPAFQAFK